MNNSNTELEAWLAGEDMLDPSLAEPEEWVAGFDADRQLVMFKLGPFKRYFLRPEKFNKRFYHQLFPLRIESWSYQRQISLFDDFCTLEVELKIRFQATLRYVLKNTEMLESINQHVKQLYAAVIEDQINQELCKLADGKWVQNGLSPHQNRIALSVCEVLTQQNLQVEALCSMNATFVEFPEVKLGKDSVYLHVLKKTFELNQQKHAELQQQQKLTQQQALAAKMQELAHLREVAEIQRKIQLQEADTEIQLLQDKEQQLVRQREVEKRLHREQIQFEQELKEISFDIQMHTAQQLETKQRLIETQQLADQLAHQALLEDTRTLAEIERKQATERRWNEVEQTALPDDDSVN